MEKEKVQKLLEYATILYSSNISAENIEDAIVTQGADEELAKEIVGIVGISEGKKQSSRGKNAMIVGIGLLAVFVFVMTYTTMPILYIVAIIAYVFGLLNLLGGFGDYIIGKRGRK